MIRYFYPPVFTIIPKSPNVVIVGDDVGAALNEAEPVTCRIITNQLLRYCVSFYVYFARLIRIVVRVNDYKPPARLERAAKNSASWHRIPAFHW
jgi:hypothetical protein